MKVSDYTAEFLHTQGVTRVFEVVGGMTTHMVDSIYRRGKIQLVSMHHEQTAAFAADIVNLKSGTGWPPRISLNDGSYETIS